MKSNYIRIGKIVNTHGIKGDLKIYLHTDFASERFEKGNRLFIGDEHVPNEVPVEVASSKPYKNMYLVSFQNLQDINKVENYKGKFLWIDEEQQKTLDEGEFYYHQIIGCTVFTEDGEELGIIKEILSPGANDVWVVKSKHRKKDILIPYIKQVVKEVNVQEKKILVELIEGLLD